MTKYVPTDEQRTAFNADHSGPDTSRSLVRMIATGKGIDRARVIAYVSHDVDNTGENDTVGVFLMELRAAGGETVRGYVEASFNVVDGVPFAADFRAFHPVMKSV